MYKSAGAVRLNRPTRPTPPNYSDKRGEAWLAQMIQDLELIGKEIEQEKGA